MPQRGMFLPLFNCYQNQRADDEAYCCHNGGLLENCFITLALFLTEELFCAAGDGTGQTCAVAGLHKDAPDKNKASDSQNDHQKNLHDIPPNRNGLR